MRKPLDKTIITQPFGANPEYYAQFGLKGHEGTDFRTKGLSLTSFWNEFKGWQTIKAVTDGVCFAHYGHPNYGTYIDLLDAQGRMFRYAHLKNVRPPTPDSVIPGKDLLFKVKEGDVIGITGNSGNTSGPHLHFMYKPASPNFNNGYFGWEDPMKLFGLKKFQITCVNADLDQMDEFKARIKGYLPELEIEISHVFIPVTVPSGTLIGEEAVKIIDQIQNLNAQGVFIFYPQNPDSAYETTSYYPNKNLAFVTTPKPTPTTILVHAFLHVLRKYINFNKIGPYIEDVEKYPTSWGDAANFDNPGWQFAQQYEQIKPYING